jgi:cytochrome b561
VTATPLKTTRALLAALALAGLLATPLRAVAGLSLEPELQLTSPAQLLVAAAPKESKPAQPAAAPPKPIDTSLDFDLLGTPAPPPVKLDDAAMKQRRWMLDLHQKIGLGLVALQLATTVVGQLNYTDKYGTNPAVTGKYELPHTVLAYSTLAVFAVDGSIALFAPSNPVKKKEYDRMTLHKVGMAIATAGMIAQGVVGIRADQLEGRIDQASVARTHLVIGYVTLAAVAVAVGALVF